MGTNAVPYLVKWIQYETPGWKTLLRKGFDYAPAKLRPKALFSEAKHDRADSCPRAFATLGPQSAPAVPELCRVFEKLYGGTNPPPAYARIGTTFLVLGTNVFPEVQQLLTNRGNAHRLGAAAALAAMRKDQQTSPVLIACLQDPNPLITEIGARSLGDIRLLDAGPPDQTVAVFTNALQRGSPWVREQITLAIAKLGMYRHDFDPAWHSLPLPALTNALTDLSAPVRNAASNAIKWWTDPDGTNFSATSGTLFGPSPQLVGTAWAGGGTIVRPFNIANTTNSFRFQMPPTLRSNSFPGR
jgi:hypothetical protein